jgi:hypothetical protein
MLNNNEATPSGEKFSFESPTMTSYLWSFDIFCITLTVFVLFVEINLMATEPPPSGENIFIRKPDLDFLLVVCSHILPKSYRFRVIRVNSIWPLQRRPLAKKIILFESPTPTSY